MYTLFYYRNLVNKILYLKIKVTVNNTMTLKFVKIRKWNKTTKATIQK
jgi:hypothetical protein